MNKTVIRLVITDLDNTLYDWVTYFATALYAMVEEASEILQVAQELLLDELREVHQRYHDSEHPFALIETRTVQTKYATLTRAEQASILDPAFHRFNSVRKQTLQLYPGVLDTLRNLSESGIPVVGHTEATVPNALFRLRMLDVAAYFRVLYAINPVGESHPDPSSSSLFVDVPLKLRYLERDERKPDPRVLMDICGDFGIEAKDALYIGDSISRDIGMAQVAGAQSAWAEYGTCFSAESWQRLVRVTHWTEEDVRRAEKAKSEFAGARPNIELKEFSQILEHFTFVSNRTAPRRPIS